jgi:hypothetical protein
MTPTADRDLHTTFVQAVAYHRDPSGTATDAATGKLPPSALARRIAQALQRSSHDRGIDSCVTGLLQAAAVRCALKRHRGATVSAAAAVQDVLDSVQLVYPPESWRTATVPALIDLYRVAGRPDRALAVFHKINSAESQYVAALDAATGRGGASAGDDAGSADGEFASDAPDANVELGVGRRQQSRRGPNRSRRGRDAPRAAAPLPPAPLVFVTPATLHAAACAAQAAGKWGLALQLAQRALRTLDAPPHGVAAEAASLDPERGHAPALPVGVAGLRGEKAAQEEALILRTVDVATAACRAAGVADPFAPAGPQ